MTSLVVGWLSRACTVAKRWNGPPVRRFLSNYFDLLLKADGASMTDCGSLFHSLMTRMLKKFGRNLVTSGLVFFQ